MNIDSAFPSSYLKASDLGQNQPVVTIDRVEVEPVGRDKEMKPIIYFTGKEKGLVLNKTNSRKIADLTGSKDTDDWSGCQIRLYATETEFAGETVECIRVKAAGKVEVAKPKPEPVAPAIALDDSDIPF
jgi:hypothetical protein